VSVANVEDFKKKEELRSWSLNRKIDLIWAKYTFRSWNSRAYWTKIYRRNSNLYLEKQY